MNVFVLGLDERNQQCGIGWIGAPFGAVLERLELPPEIVSVGGGACLVEERLSGRQLTLEGYRSRGKTNTLGVMDSIRHDESPSFLRYQYPASVPDQVIERMADISDRGYSGRFPASLLM